MISRIDDLLRAAGEAGLRLDPGTASLDESGADFLVAHGRDSEGTPWIVRAPRRPDVMARAAGERRALALVRPRLPVAVPDWRIATADIIAYPRLAGEPAAVVDPAAGGYVWRFDPTDPPEAFTSSLAAVLAALHRIDPAEAAAAALRVRSPDDIRVDLAEEMERAREILDIPDVLWARWHRWLADDDYWPHAPAVVHGDLHPPHILVDEAHRVVGLLDWTEAHAADPAMDFTLQFGAMGPKALDALLAGYQQAGGAMGARMGEHVVESWLAYPATIASFARVTGEESHRQLAQHLIDASAAQLANERG
ncbi:MAG TPA: macrolide 2'-phosphotransferase [Longimicrobiaceae bacterium]